MIAVVASVLVAGVVTLTAFHFFWLLDCKLSSYKCYRVWWKWSHPKDYSLDTGQGIMSCSPHLPYIQASFLNIWSILLSDEPGVLQHILFTTGRFCHRAMMVLNCWLLSMWLVCLLVVSSSCSYGGSERKDGGWAGGDSWWARGHGGVLYTVC